MEGQWQIKKGELISLSVQGKEGAVRLLSMCVAYTKPSGGGVIIVIVIGVTVVSVDIPRCNVLVRTLNNFFL